ncbi:hypothetical protein ACTG9Q_07075 [Actinokineospora sp. 24-640]
MTAGGDLLNPFALPGVQADSVRVLRPHEDGSHDELYVDVCGSEAAYARFHAEFNAGTVVERGGYLLVAGDSGCGKTALVNRCVFHMTRELAGSATVVVKNLDWVLPAPFDPANQLSIPDRIRHVCDELFDVLHSDGLIYQGAQDELAKEAREKGNLLALRRLSNLLKPNIVLVVCLPTPDDLVDEITNYAYSGCAKRVVFVTETSSLQSEHFDHLRYKRPSHSVPPMIITLRPITSDEIQEFVRNRLTRCQGSGIFPGVDNSGLTYLARHTNSIRRVQELLFRAYQARMSTKTNYTTDDVVTDVDFARTLVP